MLAFIIVISLAVLTLIIFQIFRYFIRSLGLKDLIEDGAVLTDHGVEILSSFLFVKNKVGYSEVESVELVPWNSISTSSILFRKPFSMRSLPTHLFKDAVVIKLKRPRPFEYVLITPRNALSFVECLKARIEESQKGVGS